MNGGSVTRLGSTWLRSNTILTHHNSRNNSGSANRLQFSSPHPTGRPTTMQYLPNPRRIQSLLRSWYLGEEESQSGPPQTTVCSPWHAALNSQQLTQVWSLPLKRHPAGPPQNNHCGPDPEQKSCCQRSYLPHHENKQLFVTIRLLLVWTTWQLHP